MTSTEKKPSSAKKRKLDADLKTSNETTQKAAKKSEPKLCVVCRHYMLGKRLTNKCGQDVHYECHLCFVCCKPVTKEPPPPGEEPNMNLTYFQTRFYCGRHKPRCEFESCTEPDLKDTDPVAVYPNQNGDWKSSVWYHMSCLVCKTCNKVGPFNQAEYCDDCYVVRLAAIQPALEKKEEDRKKRHSAKEEVKEEKKKKESAKKKKESAKKKAIAKQEASDSKPAHGGGRTPKKK